MRVIIRLIGYIAVAATIIPSLMFLGGQIELGTVKIIMLLATIIWFAAAVTMEWNLDKKYLEKAK
jgi:hypothetical protein